MPYIVFPIPLLIIYPSKPGGLLHPYQLGPLSFSEVKVTRLAF